MAQRRTAAATATTTWLHTHPHLSPANTVCTLCRYGCRKSACVIASLFAVSLAFNSIFVVGSTTCVFGFFLIRLFGQGGMSLVPKTVVRYACVELLTPLHTTPTRMH
jgi:hypothetical protein